jgi:hypothetical protein
VGLPPLFAFFQHFDFMKGSVRYQSLSLCNSQHSSQNSQVSIHSCGADSSGKSYIFEILDSLGADFREPDILEMRK